LKGAQYEFVKQQARYKRHRGTIKVANVKTHEKAIKSAQLPMLVRGLLPAVVAIHTMRQSPVFVSGARA